jgi:predicted MPP superfamily phosphohydrolase
VQGACRLLLAIACWAAPIAAPAQGVAGVVFADANGNGVRDAGERGIAGVAVSNQHEVVVTDGTGAYRLTSPGTGIVFVSVPDGYRAVGPFWQRTSAGEATFALAPAAAPATFTFVHASDTHIAPASAERTRRLRAIADSIRPAFVLVTGDLVKDALRVGEAEARGYYDLFAAEIASFRSPVYTVPGNHENFGIERAQSKVQATHPLYGREMYRSYRGPDYYSFTYGGVHFVGLNTVDIDDQWYYGHVDARQLEWLARDLAVIPSTMPVVTFDHIPFFSAMETVNGYNDGPPAPSVITVNGKSAFRHTVSNARDVIAAIGTARLPLALAGHVHVRESLRYAGIPTRFEQAAAIVGGAGSGVLPFPSGVSLYTVRAGVIDSARFVPLDPATPRPRP